jgi:hypothetical protein
MPVRITSVYQLELKVYYRAGPVDELGEPGETILLGTVTDGMSKRFIDADECEAILNIIRGV